MAGEKTTKPRTRLQRLLNKIAGGETSVNVKSKNEILLNGIAMNGGGGGGGSSPFVINVISYAVPPEGYGYYMELSATWQEIHDAFVSGRPILGHYSNEGVYEDVIEDFIIWGVSCQKSVEFGDLYYVKIPDFGYFQTSSHDGVPYNGAT